MATPSSVFLRDPFDGNPHRPQLLRSLLAIPAYLNAHLRRVRKERWWLLLFGVLFAAFFIALLFQPSIGRGGR